MVHHTNYLNTSRQGPRTQTAAVPKAKCVAKPPAMSKGQWYEVVGFLIKDVETKFKNSRAVPCGVEGLPQGASHVEDVIGSQLLRASPSLPNMSNPSLLHICISN